MLKQIKKSLSIALVIMMILSMSIIAYASEPITPASNGEVTIGITKNLVMPIATPTPATTFIFDVTFNGLVDIWDNEPPAPPSNVGPFISPAPTLASAPGAAAATIQIAANVPGITAGDVKTVQGQDTITFAPGMFPRVGMYIFTVRERANTNPLIDDVENINEYLSYSDAAFEIRVVVVNCNCAVPADCDLCVNGRRIESVATIRRYNDDGTPGDGNKVLPTPGTWDETTGVVTNPSGVAFRNIYVLTEGNDDGEEDPDPTDPDHSTLSIRKDVRGQFGETTRLFPFTVTIIENEIVTESTVTPTYIAYVVDTNVTPNAVVSGPHVVNTSFDFQLRDGYEIRFVDTPVGTRFVATETNSFAHQVAGSSNTNAFGAVDATNTAWSVDRQVATSITTPAQPGALVVAPNGPWVAIENYRSLPPQTGLTMNDIPFVVAILAIIGGAFGLVVFKVRKSKKANYIG